MQASPDPAAGPESGLGPAPPIGGVWKDSSIYLIGNIASRVVGFLTIPFYSRFLSPAQYGLIELVELSTQTIAIALGLQAIGSALSRLYHDQKDAASERAVVSTSLIATAGLSATVMLAAILLAPQLSQAVFHTDEWTRLLQAAFVAMFFSNMIELVLVYERIRDNARFFFFYTTTTLTLTLTLNILFIGVLGFGVWGFVSSKLVVSLLSSIFMLVRMRRSVGWTWRWSYLPELFRFGAPLVLSSLSYFAIHFSDRFFLSSSVSLAELGRYALSYRFAILVSALVGDSFAKSWDVKLYRYTDQADWREKFAQIASYFTYALFTTGLAIALFSPELLRIMVPTDYEPPALLLPILIAGYLAREIGDFFRTLLLINKRSIRVSQIAIGGALLNLGANTLLIPPFGIYGAAAATLVTWLGYMVVCWVIANREHRLPVRPASYLRLAALVAAVYAVATGTRVHSFGVQLFLDGAWTFVFCMLAVPAFLTSAERRGALGMLGSGALWVLSRGLPASRQRVADPGRRVLMLAYYYPPQNEIGADRPHRFARYLRRAGTPVTVVTASMLPREIGPEPEMVRIAPPQLVRPSRRRAPPAERGSAAIRASSLLLHLGERILLPYDDRLGWLPQAYVAASGAAEPGTVLISTSPPVVTHLLGLALKRRHHLPWIADFRDPLWGNPHRTAQRATLLDPLLEQMTVEHADAVIANTDAAGAVLRRRYPGIADRIHVIWNGVDAEDPVALAEPAEHAVRALTHVGTLYGDRTPLPLLMSLDRLVAAGALDPRGIQFRQIGRADPSSLDSADPVTERLARHGVRCHILTHNIPRADAWAEIRGAEWLVVLDMNRSNPGLQVPAKTYEYIYSGRPVLALTPPGSSTEQVLALSGVAHACIDPTADPARFDAALLAFLGCDTTTTQPSPAFLRQFAAACQAEHLTAIIDAVRARVR